MREALSLLSAAFVGFVSVACVAHAPNHTATCRIEVTARDGNVYIAGIGDTLADAYRGARMPADWQTILEICN